MHKVKQEIMEQLPVFRFTSQMYPCLTQVIGSYPYTWLPENSVNKPHSKVTCALQKLSGNMGYRLALSEVGQPAREFRK